MKKLTSQQILILGIALFSMFFGSGNLIFPPFMGYQAGNATLISMIGFGISAVVFPILGIIAIAKFGTLTNLAGRVDKGFAVVFPILAFLAIGPGLAIPRNAAVSYEMAIIPFFSDASVLVRIVYAALFFGISYILCIHPDRLIDTLGKFLGPILILLMLALTVGCLLHVPSSLADPTGSYQKSQLVQGFLDGYNTMDTIAALNFGAIVAVNVRKFGVKDQKSIVSSSIKAGGYAGLFMLLIYAAMSGVGAIAASYVSGATNGAAVLSGMIGYLFGTGGKLLLACIYILSCLTTCIGLLTSCSSFFASISRFSYLTWIRLFALISFVVSIFGLNALISVSVPILTAIYPIAMVLVILGLLDSHLRRFPSVYSFTIRFTAVVSIIYALHGISVDLPYITDFLLSFPPSSDLCWLIPAGVGCLAGILYDCLRNRKKSAISNTL